MGIKNGRAAMENSVEVPHKVAKGIIMWFSNSIFDHIFFIIIEGILKTHLHSNVDRSLTCSSLNVEATQVSILG
jgi:hypothetical protein